jgi:hypothetical protein
VVAPVLFWIEYAAGPDAPLPAVYVLPVCVAAWYSGQRPALILALAVPLFRVLMMLTVWAPFPGLGAAVATAAFRATVVAFIAMVFARQSEHERQLRFDLERRHALEMRAEQLRVVQVTMRTVQDIVNNCLNQLLLLRMEAEGRVPSDSLESFDQAIKDVSSRLNELAALEAYAEKQMEIGPALDTGKSAVLTEGTERTVL